MPQLNKLNVEALFGCDMYALIIAKEFRERNTEQPIAVNNQPEWTVAGPNQSSTPMNNVYFCQICKSLEDDKTWWNVETNGPRASTKDSTNHNDDKALKILAETCRKTDDKRYEKGLLWKSTEELLNNRIYAENQMKSLQRKVKEVYDLAQLKGFIKEINREQEEDITKWFHH